MLFKPRPSLPLEPVAFTDIITSRRCWLVRFSGDPGIDWPLLSLVNGWQTRFHRIDLFVPAYYLEFARILPLQPHVRILPADTPIDMPTGSFLIDLDPHALLPAAPGSAVLSPKPGANLQVQPFPKDGPGWIRLLGGLFRLEPETMIPIPQVTPDTSVYRQLLGNTFPDVLISLSGKQSRKAVLDAVTFLKQNLSANVYLHAPIKYRFDLPNFMEIDAADYLELYTFALVCNLTISDRPAILSDLPPEVADWKEFQPSLLANPAHNTELATSLRTRLLSGRRH